MNASIHDVILSDLPQRVVGGFNAARGVGEGWVSVDYKTDAVTGIGVATGAQSGAGTLTLDLGLAGPHVLHFAVAPYASFRVWLDGEKGFREFRTQHGGHSLQECRYHWADLTGRRLHIAPDPSPSSNGAFIAYLRAVPTPRPPAGARNVIATNDGFSWIALDGMASIRDVYKNFTPLRDSDVFRILWGPLGADVSGNHLTRVGTVTSFDTTHTFRACDRRFAETIRRVIQNEGDILATAADAARDVGVELFFYIRPEAFYCPFPHDRFFASRFLIANPSLRCRDEFGHEVMRMSYAHHEVQNHMLAYIAELLAYQPAGVCLAFNRSLPMMICEQPVLDEFQKRHGRPAKLPDEADAPAMLKVRQDLLHAFLQRVYKLLASRGKALSFIVDGDDAHNLTLGLDLAAAAAEGLVESICITGPAHESPFWRDLAQSGKTKVYPTIAGPARTWYFTDYAAQVKTQVHDAGFAGPFYWDLETIFQNPYNWHLTRHIGTRAHLEATIAGQTPPPPLLDLRELRGVRLDRYNPWKSY